MPDHTLQTALEYGTIEHATNNKIPLPDNQAELCERCRGINWEETFKTSRVSVPEEPLFDLGQTLCLTRTCPVCQFFLLLVGVGEENSKSNKIRSYMFARLVLQTDKKRAKFDSCYTSEIRQNEPANINFTKLRQWVQFCVKFHRGCKHSVVTPLKLINCKSRRVERMHAHQPYCTLSYVWGSPVVEDAMDDGLLPQNLPEDAVEDGLLAENLPATIEDAIACTLALNVNYLWVDRYCIDQQQHDEKAQEIGRMDEIYSGAIVGIFATTGGDAHAGLAGFSVPRGTAICHVSKELLLQQHPREPETEIDTSRWAHRGWTYQELLLSTRRIFFTQAGVYFECQELCRTEGRHVTFDHTYGLGTQLGDRPVPKPTSPPICRHIQAYTKRQLTHRSDSLKAMLGIFSHLQRAKTPVYHYWGIPIMMDEISSSAMAGFVAGLCWAKTLPFRAADGEDIVRRPAFPSWSWCGWGHAPYGVHYYFPGDKSYIFRHYVLDVKVAETDDTYTWESIWTSISTQNPTQTPSIHADYDKEASPQLRLEGRVVHFQARINTKANFVDVALVSPFPSKEEDWGFTEVLLDVRRDGLVTYTAVLLFKAASTPKRTQSAYWLITFLLLREVHLPPDCQEPKESNAGETGPEISRCAKFERVGLMKVHCSRGNKRFKELGWHTQARREEIIIC